MVQNRNQSNWFHLRQRYIIHALISTLKYISSFFPMTLDEHTSQIPLRNRGSLFRSNAMDNLVAFEMLTEESMINLQILFPEDEDLRLRIEEELQRRSILEGGLGDSNNVNEYFSNAQVLGIPYGNLI